MIICDRVCPGVMSTSSLLSCDKSQSSLLDDTPEGALRQLSSFWGLKCLQADEGSSKKASPHCCFSSAYSSK